MAEPTQEELERMSPEQLRDAQKRNCIFCHIIAGRVSSKKIYEDERCIAIMDINPSNPGHILLLPKEHFAILPQMPDDLIAHMVLIAKGLSNAALKALLAGGTNIFLANGTAAGQKAPHLMLHIIPRKEEDGITNFNLPEMQIDPSTLREVNQKIRQKLNEMLGIQKDEPINMDARPHLIKERVVEAEYQDESQESESGEVSQGEEADDLVEPTSETSDDNEDISVEKKLTIKDDDTEDSTGQDISKDKPRPAKKKSAPGNGVDVDDIASLFLGGKK